MSEIRSKNPMQTLIAFFSIVNLSGSVADARSDGPDVWRLTGRGADFELYQKQSAGKSGLEAFRVVGMIAATPTEVAAAILDREDRPLWMRDILELRTVRIPMQGSVIEYSVVKTPFIVKNRDFVIQTSVEVDPQRKQILILSRSVVEEGIPPTSRVRGELTEGKFLIEPGPRPGTAKLTADMDIDPKGSIPRWIVNRFQKGWPVGMFRALKNFVGKKVAKIPTDMQPVLAPLTDAASGGKEVLKLPSPRPAHRGDG